MNAVRRITVAGIAVASVLLLAGIASACPTCKDSLANDPDRSRHFQPRGLAVTADSSKLYVTRFLSFTKVGGRQGDDLGKVRCQRFRQAAQLG